MALYLGNGLNGQHIWDGFRYVCWVVFFLHGMVLIILITSWLVFYRGNRNWFHLSQTTCSIVLLKYIRMVAATLHEPTRVPSSNSLSCFVHEFTSQHVIPRSTSRVEPHLMPHRSSIMKAVDSTPAFHPCQPPWPLHRNIHESKSTLIPSSPSVPYG